MVGDCSPQVWGSISTPSRCTKWCNEKLPQVSCVRSLGSQSYSLSKSAPWRKSNNEPKQNFTKSQVDPTGPKFGVPRQCGHRIPNLGGTITYHRRGNTPSLVLQLSKGAKLFPRLGFWASKALCVGPSTLPRSHFGASISRNGWGVMEKRWRPKWKGLARAFKWAMYQGPSPQGIGDILISKLV